MGTGVLSQGGIGQGMKLTSHLTLVLELRICGAIPLLCLYAFMVWTGITLPFAVGCVQFVCVEGTCLRITL